jgi:hypothetical protein
MAILCWAAKNSLRGTDPYNSWRIRETQKVTDHMDPDPEHV